MLQRVFMIVIILAIVLGGGMYAYKELMPPETKETKGPVYSTEEVKKGEISVGVETSGRVSGSHGGGIKVPGDRYGGDSISYIIDEVLVEDGDVVKKGDLVARLKSPDLKTKIEAKREELKAERKYLASMTGVSIDKIDTINPSDGVTIKAPIGGRITELTAEEGMELESGVTVSKIVDDSKFVVRAKLTPTEVKKVKEGQKVVLGFENFSGFNEAKITEVNPNKAPNKDKNGNPNGFVYWITIEGENPGLVQPGMTPRVGLSVDENNISVKFFTYKGNVTRFINEKRINTRADGIVTQVFVHNMEIVKKGDSIISMAGTDMQNKIREQQEKIRKLRTDVKKLQSKVDQMEVTASMDGVISYLNVEEGETTSPGRYIGSIFDTKEMRLWVQVDDIDVVNVKQDAEVKVTVDAIPGETYKGKVTRVSTRGQEQNGITKFDVDIKVEGGPKLRPGMQANAYIKAGSAEDVPLVPLEAVFEEDGKSMVEVLKDNGTVKLTPVKIGLMNDRYAEIKSGVKVGDKVITGSSADLLPSQHIKSDDTMMPSNGDDSDDGDNGENGESDK
ncbi:MAG: efflux RND transporter periplasmic adaptor subunit [Firmicutes bacterium]|nr:efflux RND transporter periplasmic adaptor subunit [Bacillota bacterium]